MTAGKKNAVQNPPEISPNAAVGTGACGNTQLWLRAIFLAGCLCLVATSPAWSRCEITPEIQSQISRGMEQTINNNFRGAEALFRELIVKYPRQPFGYFYYGATVQAEMLDREDYTRLNEFESALDTTILLAEDLRKQDPSDIWAWFFEGSAYLYRSFMDNKRKKMWGAFRNASKGNGRLEKALQVDSTFYDALLGVGSYKYWKSSKAGALTWLPFVADDRRKGLEMVRKAIQKGRFVKWVGRDQLAWMLLDFGDAPAALELAAENHRQFPESRFFLWTLVEIYYRTQQFEAAFQLYEQMLGKLRAMPANNHYNEMTCLLHMAEIQCQRGNFREAENLLRELLSLELTPEIEERARHKQKAALALRERCAKELARLEIPE